MFVVRSGQGSTVVRFADSPISGYRAMGELHDYVGSLTGAYSVEQEYDYDSIDDVYVVSYRDLKTGLVHTLRHHDELKIVRLVTQVAINVNTELAYDSPQGHTDFDNPEDARWEAEHS